MIKMMPAIPYFRVYMLINNDSGGVEYPEKRVSKKSWTPSLVRLCNYHMRGLYEVMIKNLLS
jgi:hypothetical protein